MATRYVFAALLASSAAPTEAIEVHPSSEETNAALQRGRAAAVAHTPPNRLYAWFGVTHDGQLTPHGFLTSKLGGIAVISAHFALRSERPSDQDIQRILDEPYLMIAVFLFGHDPRFAVNSYAVLTQAERKIVRRRSASTAPPTAPPPGPNLPPIAPRSSHSSAMKISIPALPPHSPCFRLPAARCPSTSTSRRSRETRRLRLP